MEEKTRGRCAACGIRGQGEKAFLCEECQNPDGGIVVCRTCLSRLPLTLAELQMFVEGFEGIALPLPPGTTLVSPSCPICNPAEIFEETSDITVLTTRHAPN